MEQNPVWASELGDDSYRTELEAPFDEATKEWSVQRTQFLDRAGAVNRGALSKRHQESLSLFEERLMAEAQKEICRFDVWSLDVRSNPVTEYSDLPRLHPLDSADDAAAYLERVGHISEVILEKVRSLRAGLADGLVANRESIVLVIEMTRTELKKPNAEWGMSHLNVSESTNLSSDQLDAVKSGLSTVIDGEIRGALSEYVAVLERELLPQARTGNSVGIGSLPNGEECYRGLIKEHTTTELSADDIHEMGLNALAEIQEELLDLSRKSLGISDLSELHRYLREEPSLYYQTEDQILADAMLYLEEAQRSVPNYFEMTPSARCEVVPIPANEAPYTHIAYYRPPSPATDDAGAYFVNTYLPQTRPRFQAKVLAIHESVPGHHFQIALAKEMADLPEFRKQMGVTVFVEGWALYTERLAVEMGVIEAPLDRIGMLTFDAWRASRLVVDTGIHAKGWSRDQAAQFMEENTALARNNIANEVDRYITWPGQALGYKIGQLEFWALRRQAESELGDQFDIKGFHRVALEGGAVSLPILRARVEAWIEVTK